MATFFTSDLHYGHENVLKFDKRPFYTIEEHDKAIINNWNNTVGLDDEVYLLGDFSWKNATKTLEFLNQLNGQIHLIKGNHDGRLLKNRDIQARFCEIVDYKHIVIEKKDIILSHYPIMFWDGQHNGAIHIYGHLHNSYEETLYQWFLQECRVTRQLNDHKVNETSDTRFIAINAGCMLNAYIPRTLDELVTKYEMNLQME